MHMHSHLQCIRQVDSANHATLPYTEPLCSKLHQTAKFELTTGFCVLGPLSCKFGPHEQLERSA